MKWSEPKEGTDQMKKVTKQFLVFAESVTETEIRVQNWTPANYQDAVIDEIKKSPIAEIVKNGVSEVFWQMKFVSDDDGKSKSKSYFIILNALNAREAVTVGSGLFTFSELEEVKKFKVIVDDDLITEEIKKEVE